MPEPMRLSLPFWLTFIAVTAFLVSDSQRNPLWLRMIAQPVWITCGWFGAVTTGAWIAQFITRLAEEYEASKHPRPPAPPRPPAVTVTTTGLIPITETIGIDAEVMREIGDNARGNKLQPEGEIRRNQAQMRGGYALLAETGIIRKGKGSAGPVVVNLPEFTRLYALAGGDIAHLSRIYPTREKGQAR